MAIQGEKVGLYIAGCDVPIPELNILITQPTIQTILQIGENLFFEVVNFIVHIDKMMEVVRREETDLSFLSPFHFFLMAYREDVSFKKNLNTFFALVFPQYKVYVTENSIDFRDLDDKKVKGRITPFNFEILQETIDNLFIPYISKTNEFNYNPGSEKAAQIAEKLQRGRQKISEQKDEGDVSVFGSYLSILSVGLCLDINILLQYTPFQLYDIFARYTTKREYDRYVSLVTTPFMDTSKLDEPKDWLQNLYT